jgi:hypothetical protein
MNILKEIFKFLDSISFIRIGQCCKLFLLVNKDLNLLKIVLWNESGLYVDPSVDLLNFENVKVVFAYILFLL